MKLKKHGAARYLEYDELLQANDSSSSGMTLAPIRKSIVAKQPM